MRITNKMVTTKYIRSLNTLSWDLDKLNTQISSGRAFMKSSENTSAAVRAFQIRRDMSRTEGDQASIAHAQSSLTNTESALGHIEELIQNAKDRILSVNTASASLEEKKIVATELRSIQEQLLQAMNSRASDVYYFGGTNTDTPPFTVNDSGELKYNGVLLKTIEDSTVEKFSHDAMYVDIGLGAKFIPDPSDATKTIIDPKSVFQYTIPGINIVGSGTTTANDLTVSNNLYDLLGETAKQLESSLDSYKTVDALYGTLDKASMNIIYNLTEVGSKTSYLDFMTDRYEAQMFNLEERQLKTEGADPARTIIKFKTQQVAYNAALQMGTKIIQPSIFDFMS